MNTLQQLAQNAMESLRPISMDDIRRMIQDIAPDTYNQIIIDEAANIERHDYCYIHVESQHIECHTETRSTLCDKETERMLDAQLSIPSDTPYTMLADNSLTERFESLPKVSTESFFAASKRRISEMVNGGRTIDRHLITLNTAAGRLTQEQPTYLVKELCSVGTCTQCNGKGTTAHTDQDNAVEEEECTMCRGTGRIASIAYFTPKVKEKSVTMLHCLTGGLEGLRNSTIESHKGDDTSTCRFSTHLNGMDNDQYDQYITPYLDHIQDKTGDDNAIVDIYYRIIPCVAFRYRNVITSKLDKGYVVDVNHEPELILADTTQRRGVLGGMKESVRSIGHFFGKMGNNSLSKDREDLMHSTRLLIAMAVADGVVNEEEKKTLTLSIRDIDSLTTAQRNELTELLGSSDSSFITDEDFNFHNRANAETTLARMEEIAHSDGTVCEAERDIMEHLRLTL